MLKFYQLSAILCIEVRYSLWIEIIFVSITQIQRRRRILILDAAATLISLFRFQPSIKQSHPRFNPQIQSHFIRILTIIRQFIEIFHILGNRTQHPCAI